jgi:DnaJ-domain-containing protein 1
MADPRTTSTPPMPAPPCSNDTRQVLRQAHDHAAIVRTSNLAALLRWKLELGHELEEACRALGVDPETMRKTRKNRYQAATALSSATWAWPRRVRTS